jgi:peptidoglycan/LPS O-acetylase OafA/YrhL
MDELESDRYMVSAEAWKLGRRPALDGLRGVAILFVLLNHLVFLVPPNIQLFTGGFFGVDIFFVLSGFLITSLLLEEHARAGRISLTSFYRRRAFRLFPALWALLIATFVFSRMTPWAAANYPLTSEWHALVAVLLYLANWAFLLHSPGAFGVGQLWSLIEEQFYLVWPVALIILLKINRPMLPRWFVGLSILGSLAACAIEFHGDQGNRSGRAHKAARRVNEPRVHR